MDALLPYINPESVTYKYEDCNDGTYCECISVATNFDFMDITILII